MISRIQLYAYGRTPDEVTATLYPHADAIENLMGISVGRGKFKVERQLNEPIDSVFAFSGQLTLHPDISLNPIPLDELRGLHESHGLPRIQTDVSY